MGSFLYPRLVQITRPNQDATLGAQPYSGLRADNETVIASGIAAHIQVDKGSLAPAAKLASDVAYETFWKIIFKVARGLVKTGDIITDELGNRYQVNSSDWGPLVTSCRAQILQA